MLPLYITTKDRVANNYRLYEDTIAPHYVPSGGGFSITVFTLENLYELFKKGQCWWTQSNNELPLIRYTGCKFTLYRAESSDYMFNYHKCYPMNATMDTYNSTQPSIMSLNNRKIIMKCKKHNNLRKTKKTLYIKPPSQMTNKWYFQKELAQIPLLLTMATATSLDRWYLNSNSVSTTIGFTGLNANVFKYHNWQTPTTHGYHPRNGLYLWSWQQNPGQTKPTFPKLEDVEAQNLIYLGNPTNIDPGTTIKDANKNHTTESWTQWVDRYTSSSGYWGNIFIPFYLTRLTGPIAYSKYAPADLLKKHTPTTDGKNWKPGKETDPTTGKPYLQYFTEPFVYYYRYNAHPDTGESNNIFFVSTTDVNEGYYPPQDESLQRPGLPLWLALWGQIDWQKLSKGDIIDTQKFIVIKTPFTNPKHDTIIPIDDDFLNGRSPYRPEGNITPSDSLNWHPKTTFQYKSINNICVSGPGTIKLPENVSAEAHCKFCFYFKLGGCAQSIKNIEDPQRQPDFPHPGNILSTTSLQSPETPIENYLYSFDWRRHYLTPRATQRISSIKEIEKTALPIAGISRFNAAPPPQESSEGESTDEEKEKETLLQLLRHLRKQRRSYQQRILHLMGDLE